MPSTHLATFDGLVKRYGDTTAVEGLSLAVPEGTVCGLLGPNGAGKTTAIRVLLGLATPSAGSTTLLGESPGSPGFAAAVRKVGTLIEQPAIYARATPRQNMQIEASARRLRDPGRQIDELLALVGLSARADTRSGAFSLGMKQRLGLALALLGGPQLIVLDEPTNGLDPAGIVEIRELIKTPARARHDGARLLAPARRGRAHVRSRDDHPQRPPRRRGHDRRAAAGLRHVRPSPRASTPPTATARRCCCRASGSPAQSLGDGRLSITGPIHGGEQINRALADGGIYLSELRTDKAHLEQVFLSLTSDHDEAALPQLETIA